MKEQRTVSIVPTAFALVESLRGLGYSTETAIADLIDNSIGAGASRIAIDIQWHEGAPVVGVLDDGNGMTEDELAEGLRLGGKGPSVTRAPTDLGRFGMGLKTASLSQCRRLTIVSSKNGRCVSLILDIDIVADAGWVAVRPESLPVHPLVEQLIEAGKGTLVLWERMDARSDLAGLDREAFFLRLAEVRDHLGMIFHRFLSGDAKHVAIAVNSRRVKPWDPIQRDHPATRPMGKARLRLNAKAVTVTPWVLPHRDRFANDAEYTAAGGPGGWAARQGFYIYRGDRLLVAGSWLGLGGSRAWTREESSRLARIEVDLPTDLDDDWRIDVRKAHARPPGALRPRLTQIASACRNAARDVFAYRGRRTHTGRADRSHEPMWLAQDAKLGTRYLVNRKHPAVAGIRERMDDSSGLLDSLLDLIERSVPIERIWLDVSDSPTTSSRLVADDIEGIAARLALLSDILPPDHGPAEKADLLLSSFNEPSSALRDSLIAMLERKLA